MKYNVITVKEATGSEIELYEILKSLKGRGRIQLNLLPYGAETISKRPVNQCKVEFTGESPWFKRGKFLRINKISESFYDFLVREFHNTY